MDCSLDYLLELGNAVVPDDVFVLQTWMNKATMVLAPYDV